MKAALPGISVTVNAEKPRRGYFEVRVGGQVVLSLPSLQRPFKALREKDMSEVRITTSVLREGLDVHCKSSFCVIVTGCDCGGCGCPWRGGRICECSAVVAATRCSAVEGGPSPIQEGQGNCEDSRFRTGRRCWRGSKFIGVRPCRHPGRWPQAPAQLARWLLDMRAGSPPWLTRLASRPRPP